ncbi:MAG: universal stress protein [Bacteroidales bacterium]|nr:universal stress protein [Bacteroidales bacterium]
MTDREILVGVDFSNASLSALRISVDIANRTNANIKMLWVETAEKDPQEAEAILNDFCATFKRILGDKEISYIITKGRKIYNAITKIINQEKPFLVVIGTNGNSGFDERYAGANAYKTIADSKVPVLTIRENFNFNKPLEHLILPIDSTEETRQKVPWTVNFARMFPNITIHILGLQTTNSHITKGIVMGYVESVAELLNKKGIKYTTELRDADNVTMTTLDYAKEIDADLVVIMTEQEKTLSNLLFLGPYAQQMVNLSPYPVLTIPSKQVGGYSI